MSQKNTTAIERGSMLAKQQIQHSKDPTTVSAARDREQKQIEGCCEICGSLSKLSFHHCDGNPINNANENLQTLCLSCHNFWY
jgi:hypothetical protein